MAIAPGYVGKVTFTAQSGETNTVISVANTVVWAVDYFRPMVNITSLGSDAHEFSPHAGIISMVIRGFIDQAVNPGTFNLVAALVEAFPSQGDATKKESFFGWLERFRMISAVDGANQFEAVIRGTGNFEHTWT